MGGLQAVLEHLEAVRQDIIETVDDFLPKEQGPQIVLGPAGREAAGEATPFRRYEVNGLVGQTAHEATGRPQGRR